MTLIIDVVGTPAAQGSKRGFVVNGRAVLVESSKKVKPWRQDVTEAVKQVCESHEALTGPVMVSVVFYLRRPGYHFHTGTRAHELKPNAPTYVDKRPDGDKLLRSTLDALTASGVFRDDAQVAILTGVKRYADRATGARIEIQSLEREPSSDVPPSVSGEVLF
jgi:Holliday junction resolvase RusA-like endonuclease